MNFFPLEDITYKTQLSPQEVMSRLNEHIEPDSWLRKRIYEYSGETENNTFTIFPLSRTGMRYGRLSTKIVGELSTNNGETTIDIEIRWTSFTKGFFALWYSFFVFGLIILLVEPAGVNIDEDLSVYNFSAFCIMGYVVMMYGFNTESTKAKEHLLKLFGAKIVSS